MLAFGAPARPQPCGSSIVDVPMPASPVGAFAGHSRPKAQLIDNPRGLLAPVKCGQSRWVFDAIQEGRVVCGENLHTPSSAEAWPPVVAKDSGITRVSPRGSIERNEPGSSSSLAGVSPKLELLATRILAGSRTWPGSLNAANAGLSWIGPPGRNWPAAEIAEAPGIFTATMRPCRTSPLSVRPAYRALATLSPPAAIKTKKTPQMANTFCFWNFVTLTSDRYNRLVDFNIVLGSFARLESNRRRHRVNLSAPKKARLRQRSVAAPLYANTVLFSNRHPASPHIASSKLPGSGTDWVTAVTDAPAVSSFPSDTVSVVGSKFGAFGSTLYRS
jgi:hypothetical protein